MIQIENLTKVYERNNAPALNGVSFSLPDKGFVFIVGKSGSGKSTLLNLLGGLDNLTAGEIIADGNKFSELSVNGFDNYRNSYVGFIFQDFCLMESLTVRENIELSLNLQNKIDHDRVLEIIKKVDLSGFENRPVKKLSGGQKQRVAIARALIKNPKLILADEPTGNLDSKTSVQILELLKELSRDNLVVIVSHNIADAYKYADRIIEISDGKILQDIENTGESNSLDITKDSITIPYGAVLTEEELSTINTKKRTREIKQHKPRFKDSVQPSSNGEKYVFQRNSIRPMSAMSLSCSFLKKKWLSFVLTAVLVSAILIVLGLCQMFVSYNGQDTIKEAFQNSTDTAFILKKGYLSDDIFKEVKTDKLGRISEDEIQEFYDAGYSGKVYRLNNSTMGPYQSPMEYCRQVNYNENFKNFYARHNLGLLECDMEFLTKIFGNENGEVEVLSGTLDYTTKPYGMILTDYMADSFLYYNKQYMGSVEDPYSRLIGGGRINNRFAVLAVINTNYKTRYKDLIEKYNEYFNAETKIEQERLYNELMSSDMYIDFYNELTQYLSICYSTNPNYRQDAIDNILQSRIVGYFNNLDVYDTDGNLLGEGLNLQCDNVSWAKNEDISRYVELEDNEITLLYTVYNDLFGTNITQEDTSEFEPKTVVFKNYDECREMDDEPLYTKTYTIKKLSMNAGTQSLLSDNEFKFVRQYDVYTHALYFDSPKNCSALYYKIQDTSYYMGSQSYDAIYQVVDIVGIFKEYFGLIVGILSAVGILLLVSFSLGNIRSRRYDIGVLRALGCKSRSLAMMFFVHGILLGILAAILSVLGIVFLTGVTNTMLIAGFKKYVKSPIIGLIEGIDILVLAPSIIMVDIAMVLGLTVISGIIPIIAINRIKPMKIIRAKE